jgi:hypothetical protein
MPFCRYWDHGAQKLYMIPPQADDPTSINDVVAAQLENLISLSDASHVQIVDIHFKHASPGDRVSQ